MKRLLPYLGLLLVGILIGYLLTIRLFPYLAYQVARTKLATPENVFRYPPLTDEESRAVVKPNPDFLYATCFYNLGDGPLQLTGELPDSTYWSLALYLSNTTNFYVKNDREFDDNTLDVLLAEEDYSGSFGGEIIWSPEEKGFILFRILVTDHREGAVARYRDWQQSITLKPFE